MNAETAPAMHGEHSSAAIEPRLCVCGCGQTFTPRRDWQRFASTKCRDDYHARRAEAGMRGKVSSVRALKGGGASITLRFTAEERDRALALEPGKLLEVLEQ